ncbi:restriction endonuclease subunit S [Glaesserella parasuis]|nr:restriction endonuclease subunit S [Glaesserella parasuis]
MSSLSNLTIHSIGGGWGKDVEDEGLELVAVIRGTDIPNLEINNIQGVPFRYETQKKIQSRLLQIGDLVIEISGGSASSKQRTGRCLYITDELLKNLGGKVIPASFCKLLRLDRKKVNSKYVYYQIKAMHLSDEIASFENQSTGISNFQFNRFIDEIRPSILDIEVQNKIVNFLEKIDLKIINNININQTLEQIAQTIFKSWFIDFDPVHAKANALASGQTAEQATQAAMAVISGKNTQELHRLQTANPEQYQQLWEIAEAFPSGFDEDGVPRGWEERELSYLFEFLSGAQPPKSEHIYEEKEGYERFIQNRDYSNDNHKTYIPISKKNKRCTEKDILMDKYGEAGKVRYGIKGAYNVALAKIVPQKDNLREFLRSYFTQDKIRNYLSSSSMASTRNSLNSTTFTRMKVIVPNDFLLSTFDKLANEKIDKILQIKQENIELSKLRDYLLPKLLSGEV